MKTTILETAAVLAAMVVAGTAAGQTIYVTTSADATDVPTTATIDDLPGPDGVVSFREALRASDNTPGHQTVGFQIPEDDWYLPDIYPGLVLLQGSFSFGAGAPVTIDGTTQTAFTGDTNPDGHELILPLQTYLGGDGTVVTGLHASRVEISGSGSDIHGNTGSMYIVLYFGSGSIVHDNEAGTIKIDQSNENVIVRNTTSRVRIDGWFGGGAPATNNRVGGPDPADRNFITGWGNYGEHGVPGGTTLELFDTADTLVQNNYIGTTPDGMAIGASASTVGIGIEGMNHNLRIHDNLIATRAVGVGPVSGVIYGQPVYIQAYGGYVGITDHVEIYGNTLGLNAAGQPLLGAVNGITVARYAQEYAHDVRIGGPAPGQGNVIAGHLSTGIYMEIAPGVPPSEGAAIRVSGNSIYDNGDIGIDLLPNTWTVGPTENDPLDADVGANWLQNYPDVAEATTYGQAVRVVGQLSTAPSNDYTLEFFASPACDATGFGPGQVFLGTTAVSTDAAGNAAFDVLLDGAVAEGWVITSTATVEPLGATSEFSACVTMVAGAMPGDLNGDGVVNFADVLGTIAAWGPCEGECPADQDGDGVVGFGDVLFILANWS
ncbi:MAG: hypothetical protein ACYTGP_02195 [Planctomycetota bacterium]|jgi:hypothetical protein